MSNQESKSNQLPEGVTPANSGVSGTIVKTNDKPVSSPAFVAAEEDKNISTTGKVVLAMLDDYIVKMSPPKAVSVSEGIVHQASLFHALETAITKLGDDFELVWSLILAKVDEHAKGAFDEASVFRFIPHVEMSPDKIKSFLRLVNLLKITANVQGRQKSLQQVDFNMSMEFIRSAEGRQRVLNFYNV